MDNQSTIITNVDLIDGSGGGLTKGVTVSVQGDKIAGVNISASCESAEANRVIDGTGCTLMPGLIDCHDHLASVSYDIASRWGLEEPRSTRMLRIASYIEQTLQTGYTTLRDAGGLDAGFRMAIEQGLINGPRILVALGFITPTGGMADKRSQLGYGPPNSKDSGLPDGVADGPVAMRETVRDMVRAGADVIKVATTGGASSAAGLGPNDILFQREELEAVVDEAHSRGRKVMCHALGGQGLRLAVEVGVDSIEHGTYLDEDPDLLELMAQKEIYYAPTFSVYTFHQKQGTPHGRARAASLREHHVKSLQMALTAGVKVVAGTDEGGWEHGNNAHELVCLVDAGASPEQAIFSATGQAAECIGLEDEIGMVKVGKKADLIVVKGNPLEDVSILERGSLVALVMKDGQIVRDEL